MRAHVWLGGLAAVGAAGLALSCEHGGERIRGALDRVTSVAEPPAAPEFRAIYINRFQWPDASPEVARSNIREMMRTAAEHNFNAVLFQVRGQCDVHYPSPDEPWSNVYGWEDPGWDPLEFAIGEAHANGLEFHAYINTHTLAQVIPPAHTEPEHPYNLHGPSAPDGECWLLAGEDGERVVEGEEYVWLSPGIPAASAWTRAQIMHVVNHYDIDGLTFDRIRTPGREYSHDAVTQARFEGPGNPWGLAWGDFMRLQITTDLERIYGAVNEVKPHVVISASPFGIHSRQPGGYQGTGTESYHHHYQDSFRWLEGGSLDLMFPMIYWPIGSAHPFEVLVADFMQHTGGRHLAPAFNRRASEEIIASIQEVRNQGGAGTAYWVYGRGDWETFDVIYPAPAPIPERTWKTHPVAGIVVGQVRSLAGAPFVDAQVRLGEEMRLSAGDGFFAFLNVPPGTHALTVELPAHDGYPGSTLSAEVTVAAGQTVRQNLDHLGGVRP